MHPPGGAWTSLGRAADTVAFCGSVLAFIAPENATGPAGTDLNGDGDAGPGARAPVPATGAHQSQTGRRGPSATTGSSLRTAESAQGATDSRNRRAVPSALTEVMWGYRLDRLNSTAGAGHAREQPAGRGALRLTGMRSAVPYKVSGCSVKFLTRVQPARRRRSRLCEGTGGVRSTRHAARRVTRSSGSRRMCRRGHPDRHDERRPQPLQSDDGDAKEVRSRASGRCIETLGGAANPTRSADRSVLRQPDLQARPSYLRDRPHHRPPNVPCVTGEGGRPRRESDSDAMASPTTSTTAPTTRIRTKRMPTTIVPAMPAIAAPTVSRA